MATSPPKVSRYTSMINSEDELCTITKKDDGKSRNLAECGISLLFPCVHGNYGCNVVDTKLGSNMLDEDDNTYSQYTSYTNDTNDNDEKLLRRVASWMSSFSQLDSEYDWNRKDHDDNPNTKPDGHKEEENINANDDSSHTQCVKFEYPPISSFKRVSRYTKEETKKLFFSEHELRQIYRDRMSSSSLNEIETIISKSPSSESTLLKSSTKSPTLRSPKSVAAVVNDVTVMMAET